MPTRIDASLFSSRCMVTAASDVSASQAPVLARPYAIGGKEFGPPRPRPSNDEHFIAYRQPAAVNGSIRDLALLLPAADGARAGTSSQRYGAGDEYQTPRQSTRCTRTVRPLAPLQRVQ